MDKNPIKNPKAYQKSPYIPAKNHLHLEKEKISALKIRKSPHANQFSLVTRPLASHPPWFISGKRVGLSARALVNHPPIAHWIRQKGGFGIDAPLHLLIMSY